MCWVTSKSLNELKGDGPCPLEMHSPKVRASWFMSSDKVQIAMKAASPQETLLKSGLVQTYKYLSCSDNFAEITDFTADIEGTAEQMEVCRQLQAVEQQLGNAPIVYYHGASKVLFGAVKHPGFMFCGGVGKDAIVMDLRNFVMGVWDIPTKSFRNRSNQCLREWSLTGRKRRTTHKLLSWAVLPTN